MTQSNFGFDQGHKKARKKILLEEMNRLVPWAALVGIIQPQTRSAHQALGRRPPFALETMLRIHCLQLWGTSATRQWKKSCTSGRCMASSMGWRARRAFLTRRRSCGSAICCRSMPWPSR